jgi:hypothetical protein
MRFALSNVRSLYRAGSLMTLSREISKYVRFSGSAEVRWEGGGTEPAGEYIFSMEREMRIMN